MNRIFEPYTLADVPLRNRLVRSATVSPYATGGIISTAGVMRYRALAEHGVGLIITDMAYISLEGQASKTQMGICTEEQLPSHQAVAKAVHDAGGRVFLQLNHGGAAGLGELPPSPSGVESPYTNKATRTMSEQEIHSVTREFAAAAIRARVAGYDGVEIHCAHGYLLSQFMSPHFNRRVDAYGGSAENRFRFAGEVITAVRHAVGPDFPVCIKVNSNAEVDDQVYGADLEQIGRKFSHLGVSAVEVSGCDFTPRGRAGEHNYYLDRAAQLKRSSGLPILLVGGIRTRADMATVLDAGIDLISMSRPFLCQPDLTERLAVGEDSKCISCSKCFPMLWKFEEEGRLCIQRNQDEDREG